MAGSVWTAQLGAVRPELAAAFSALVIAAAAQLGLGLQVPEYGGTRSHSTQVALYNAALAAGGGTLAYPVGTPGNSRHEYGAAFDVDIVSGGANSDGSGADADYRALAGLAPGLGLTAGYHFTRSDPYHFQLAETLAASQAAWAAVSTTSSLVVAVVAAAVLLALAS